MICAAHAGKRYLLFNAPSDRLKSLLWGRWRQYSREFWALQDVSFSIDRGEVVGIVGRNGAGKSTLLQMVCGTLAPTSGTIKVNGRVAALLELGAGFSPDFTGLENVYMNAAILGLARAEVDARLDSILAFADIGNFIHQPVKTYSSGMFMRLAFAVATSVEPDVLVIDEALSVGDGAFARKSFDRIMALKDKGATILLCSHSMTHVQSLCSKAIWMEDGKIKMMGEASRVVAQYETALAMASSDATRSPHSSPTYQDSPIAPDFVTGYVDEIGSAVNFTCEARLKGGLRAGVAVAQQPTRQAAPGTAVITHVHASADGRTGRDLVIQSGQTTLRFELGFASDPSLPVPSFVVVFSHANGAVVASSGSANDSFTLQRDAAGFGQVSVEFPEFPLLKGDYTVNVLLGCERAIHLYEAAERVVTLRVVQTGLEQGLARFPHQWNVPCQP